jgi:hypothetical protein
MPTVEINYLAVIVATFASMALGVIWYAPFVFGREWMKLVGLTETDAKDGRGAPMALMLVGALVAAYVMAHFVGFTGAKTLADGARTGAWVGIGFVFTAAMGESIFAQKPARLLAITGGYQVINLIMMGAILAAWQ